MTKALGMRMFLKFETAAVTDEVCLTSLDGGGVEANIEELEPCMSDLTIVEFPGDVKYSQQTLEYKIDYDVTDIAGGSVETSTFYLMEQACIDRELITYTIEIPTNPVLYASRTAYVASQTEVAKERNQDMKVQAVLVPQTDWAYSATNPTPTP